MGRILLTSCFLILSINTQVGAKINDFYMKKYSDSLLLGASISIFNSKTVEHVYLEGKSRKISELTWQVDNAKLLGISAEYTFFRGLGIYVDYKKNILNNSGTMDDLDWANMNDSSKLTHWSHHNDTRVKNISILDAGLKYSILYKNITPIRVDEVDIWLQVGYKQEKHKLEAYGGYGRYPAGYLLFPDKFIGGFKHEYKGYYAGLGAKLKRKKGALRFDVKYAPSISASYSDRHNLRDFTETTDFDKTSMLSFNIGAGYEIDSNQEIDLSYEYTSYKYIRGDRTRHYDNGTTDQWNDSVALSSNAHNITFKYSYKF